MNTREMREYENSRVRRREFLRAGAGGALVTSGIVTPADASTQATGPTVYVGSQDADLHAVDTETGERQWVFTNPGDYILSSPTVANGTVYVGSQDETLYAVDAMTGQQEWAFTRPESFVDSSPTIVDGTVFVGSNDQNVYAVDAETGEMEWKFATTETVYASPAVVDETVYVASRDMNMYALDAASGELYWSYEEVSGAMSSSPTVVDGVVYFGAMWGWLHALDAETGEYLWGFTKSEDDGPGTVRSVGTESSPVVVDGTVYVGSMEGVYAIDAETGDQQWVADGFGEQASSVTVANGTVYAVSGDDVVRALDAATGDQQWAYTGASDIESAPTATDETVYIGTGSGSLYRYGYLRALDAETGDEKWVYDAMGDIPISSPTVVKNPDGGSSTCSRTGLGALGHHGGWQYAGQSLDIVAGDETFTSEAESGEPIEFETDLDISDELTIDELQVTPAVDGEFTVGITGGSGQLRSTPAVPMLEESEQLGFLSVDSTLDNEEIEEVTFRYTVDASLVEKLQTEPDEMVLYRFEVFEDGEDRWVGYPTDLIEQTDTKLVYETTAPGLSEWAAGSSRPEISITDAEAEVSAVQTGEQFDIDVELTNSGQADDVFVTELLFEGEVVAQRRPQVPANNSIIITFSRAVEEAGEYTVRVNDVEVGRVTVSGVGTSDDDSRDTLLWIAGGLGALGGGRYLLSRSSEDESTSKHGETDYKSR